jgi:drug/metabolite transporter (DMT)-like permease
MAAPATTASAPRARLAIVAAALLFSTGGAAIKLVSLPPLQLAGLRAGIAALTLLALLRVPWRSFQPASVLIGVVQAVTLILFVIGNKLTTAASTIFLQSTAPLYVLALSPVLLNERIRRSDVGFLALFALGLGCFFVGVDPTQTTAPDPARGNLAGLAGGVAWAATVLGLRWLAVRAPTPSAGRDAGVGRPADLAAAATIVGNALVFLVCLPALSPLPQPTSRDVLVIAWLGVFQVGAAYAFVARGVRQVRAFDATMLMLIEPVLNPVWAWLLHGERPGPWSLAGGAMILATTAVRTWYTPSADD